MLGNMPIKEEGGGGSTVGGISAQIMQIPSRDAYSFGLQLLDIFFTKDELASSLLFKSKKSTKQALDHGKVEKLLGCIRKRYGDEWDLKSFTQKTNQKCRDSKPNEMPDPKAFVAISGSGFTSNSESLASTSASTPKQTRDKDPKKPKDHKKSKGPEE